MSILIGLVALQIAGSAVPPMSDEELDRFYAALQSADKEQAGQRIRDCVAGKVAALDDGMTDALNVGAIAIEGCRDKFIAMTTIDAKTEYEAERRAVAVMTKMRAWAGERVLEHRAKTRAAKQK